MITRWTINALILIVAFVALSMALYLDPNHDYVPYIRQWKALLNENHWHKTNAYGPTHNAMAVFYWLHPALPKVIFTVSWLSCVLYLSRKINENPLIPVVHRYFLLAILFFNPLFWIFTVRFGTNDMLMAALVLFSLVLYSKKQDHVSGVLIAVAIAVKFIPIVMLPFLVLTRSGIRFKFAVSATISLIVIFAIGYLIWGSDLLFPFEKGTNRTSTMLSVFRYLRGIYSPLHTLTDSPNVDSVSIYLCISTVVALFLLHLRYQFDSLVSSIVAMTLMIGFYLVGNHQFYITVFLLQIFWVSTRYREIMETGCKLLPSYLFVLWIAFASALFIFTNEYRQANLKEIIGLPTFLLSMWMVVSMMQNLFRLAHSNTRNTAPDV